MKGRCILVLASTICLIACTVADETQSHKLAKRQLSPQTSAQRAFPLSRSRQFPPPDELEADEVEEEENEPLPPVRRYSSSFRGRQLPDEPEDYVEEYSYTEAPATTTTTTTTKSPNRISAFNRNANRPRFGANSHTTASSTTAQARTTAAPKPRSRSPAAPAQRIDVVAEILDSPLPSRSPPRSNSGFRSTTSKSAIRKPALEVSSTTVATRRIGTTASRGRARGRLRTRTSTTTTTTTTTTTAAPEDYYYYYYDDEEEAKKPLATTTSTTTTTTTPKPSIPRRPSLNRGRPSNTRTVTTPRPVVKFDPESQFQPPPDDTVPEKETSRATKRFTTSTTEATPPGGIPPHLRGMYKPRTDGRFVDYLRDPNRPRELKGFDLTNYPFYIKVPEDIVFECDDKKDGYYASVPHHCQLFHYCFAGSRYDFLCANYTLYDQTTFTCRFANNVDCLSSEKFYYRNDDLWKETTTIPPAEQKKKKVVKDSDYEEDEDEYDDEEYYDDEEERRRPSRRRRNRRRKNRRKPSS